MLFSQIYLIFFTNKKESRFFYFLDSEIHSHSKKWGEKKFNGIEMFLYL